MQPYMQPRHSNTITTRSSLVAFALLYLFSSFMVGISAKGQRCQKSCNVLERKAKTIRPCKFPFFFEGRWFRGCTDFKDDDGKFWCSTKVNRQNHHIGGKGYWGHCDKTTYTTSCKVGSNMNSLQEFIENKLGAKDYCSNEEFVQEKSKAASYPGRTDCACKPMSECGWTLELQSQYQDLPKRNRLRKKVIQLIRDSICSFRSKTVRCCEDARRPKPSQRPRKRPSRRPSQKPTVKLEDSGLWKPDAEKGECGEDLNLQFIICEDVDQCLAKRNEFPYMALLGYDVLKTGQIFYTCGASVVNKKYVMTAAHCHNEDEYAQQIREVILGEYVVGVDPDCERGRCSPNIQKFGVEKVIIHEEWDSSRRGFVKGHDIALVRLDKSILLYTEDSLASSIVPVCLPWKSNQPRIDNVKDGSNVTITGWGRITNNNYQSKKAYLAESVATRTLRKVELPITVGGTKVDVNCRASNRTMQFCAGGVKGFDSCSGDSGGPAAFRESTDSPWYQLGIVSYGSSRCGQSNRPAVYTRIDAFLPWIEANLEE